MRIEHVALWVNDLEQMRTFYATYLGASANEKYTNHQKEFESYFLTFPDSTCRLELMRRPDISGTPRESIGYAHLAFAIGSKQAVDTLTKRLEADGFSLIDGPRTTGDGYYESVFLDPEGNKLELTI